jgi:hypothetical protein
MIPMTAGPAIRKNLDPPLKTIGSGAVKNTGVG